MVNGRQDEGDDTRAARWACAPRTPAATSGWSSTPPPSIAGPCNAAPAAFGPVIDQNGVTNDVVVGRDAPRPGRHRHERLHPFTNANDIAGNFVYVDRGLCTFQTKADNADGGGRVGASSSATTSPASRRSRWLPRPTSTAS